MTLYTSDGRQFDGMDQPTVQSLLNELGSNATFVDLATYNAYVVAHTPAPHIPTYLELRNAAYPSYIIFASALAAKENGDSTAYNAAIASIAATDAQYPAP